MKPVTWAPIGTRKRLKQGKARTQIVTQALLEPAKVLLRQAMREVRSSGHRVMAVKQVHDAIYEATEAVKAASLRSKRPINVTNDAATYRGVTKLTEKSLKARDAVTRALKITVANERRLKSEYEDRCDRDVMLRRRLYNETLVPALKKLQWCNEQIEHSTHHLGDMEAVISIYAQHADYIRDAEASLSVPLNAYTSKTLNLEHLRLRERIEEAVTRCQRVEATVADEQEKLNRRVARLETEMKDMQPKYEVARKKCVETASDVDQNWDGLGSVPAVVNGVRIAQHCIKQFGDLLDPSRWEFLLTDEAMHEEIQKRRGALVTALKSIRHVAALADHINIGPARRLLKQTATLLKDEQHLAESKRVSTAMKSTRKVVSRVQDTLIWVMKAEDFDDEEKMQGFQAMVADANARTAELAAVVKDERGRRFFVAGMVQRWYLGQRVRVRLRILRLAAALRPALVDAEANARTRAAQLQIEADSLRHRNEELGGKGDEPPSVTSVLANLRSAGHNTTAVLTKYPEEHMRMWHHTFSTMELARTALMELDRTLSALQFSLADAEHGVKEFRDDVNQTAAATAVVASRKNDSGEAEDDDQADEFEESEREDGLGAGIMGALAAFGAVSKNIVEYEDDEKDIHPPRAKLGSTDKEDAGIMGALAAFGAGPKGDAGDVDSPAMQLELDNLDIDHSRSKSPPVVVDEDSESQAPLSLPFPSPIMRQTSPTAPASPEMFQAAMQAAAMGTPWGRSTTAPALGGKGGPDLKSQIMGLPAMTWDDELLGAKARPALTQVEYRVDNTPGSDGLAYTKEEFLAHYGSLEQWNMSKPQP